MMFRHLAKQSTNLLHHSPKILSQPKIRGGSTCVNHLAYLSTRTTNLNHVGVFCFSTVSSSIQRRFSVKDYPEASRDARALKTTFDLVDPNAISTPPPHPLTKIVATIGPTSEQLEPLQKVVQAGMKIMRLNFSHATKEEVELRIKNLALCQASAYKHAHSFTHNHTHNVS
jgi:hypothetical protein